MFEASPVARAAAWCERTVRAGWFNVTSFAAIIVNALVLGLETYDKAVAFAGEALHLTESLCLIWFATELAIRFGTHLAHPAGFLRDSWNLFDLTVVVAPLFPGVRENVTLLRLIRLARIIRTFRLFPSLRLILAGLRHSLPGLGSFLLIAALMVYGYAMIGWMVFGEVYPDKYGTVGRGMLTLFLLLSLDGITDTFEAGRAVTEWSVLYYASYIIVACYLLTNLLVGVVLKALEEAHQSEPAGPGTGAGDAPSELSARSVPVSERLAQVRAALDMLEREILRELTPANDPCTRPDRGSHPDVPAHPERLRVDERTPAG